ncbi:MAG: HepT-like ribonuclease domain-containing protein [Cyanobacteria bacterium J06627_32]
MQQQDSQYLVDVLHAANRILEYIKSTSLQTFYQDVQLQDKVMRRLLSIEKAAKRISPQTRHELSAIAWSNLIGMKARLLQEDPVIDVDQVWSITQAEIPILVQVLDRHVLSERETNLVRIPAQKV